MILRHGKIEYVLVLDGCRNLVLNFWIYDDIYFSFEIDVSKKEF